MYKNKFFVNYTVIYVNQSEAENVSTRVLSLPKLPLGGHLKESFQWKVLTFYYTTVENASIPVEYLTTFGLCS